MTKRTLYAGGTRRKPVYRKMARRVLRVSSWILASSALIGCHSLGGPSGKSANAATSNSGINVGAPLPEVDETLLHERWNSCAKLVSPEKADSAPEPIIERPVSVQQLLQNLKLAWDKELLLLPSFYDEANLLRFFNGSKVTWEKPGPIFPRSIVGVVNSDVFPGLTVSFDSKCFGPGPTVVSFIKIQPGASQRMTLSDIRSSFGKEAENLIDTGNFVTDDGPTYTPTNKGFVAYEGDIAKEQREGVIYTRFYFEMGGPSPLRKSDPWDAPAVLEIKPADEVQNLEMKEARTQGN